MRHARAAWALGALVLLGGWQGLVASEAGARTGMAAPVFGGEVFVSTTDRIGEPGIKVADDGTVYVHAPGRVWRSDDGAQTFKKLPFAFGVNPCGCDADVAIDRAGNVYYSDLAVNLQCVAVSSSLNQGQSWMPNPLACGIDGGFVDRQWIESDGGTNVWLTFYGGAGLVLARAPMAPAPVFVPMQSGYNGVDFVQWNGYLAVDRRDGAVYATYNTQDDKVVVHRTFDGGLTLERVVVAKDRGDTFDSFTVPAVDDAGNVYVVWTERVGPSSNAQGTDTYVAASTDRGATWGAPVKVNRGPATTTFPWIVAGSDGRVGIAYYGSAQATDPNKVSGDWHVYYAFSSDATAPSPSFAEVLAVPHKVKTGPICTAGTGCGNTREFLDFFAVHRFPDGRAVIVFNDQTGLSPGNNPWVKVVRQVGGELLRTAAPPPPPLPSPGPQLAQGLPLGVQGEPFPQQGFWTQVGGLRPASRWGEGIGNPHGFAQRLAAGMET
jgi:hypothetical protein